MDLRELRSKVSEMVSEADSLSIEVFVDGERGILTVRDIYINENGDVMIETE